MGAFCSRAVSIILHKTTVNYEPVKTGEGLSVELVVEYYKQICAK